MDADGGKLIDTVAGVYLTGAGFSFVFHLCFGTWHHVKLRGPIHALIGLTAATVLWPWSLANIIGGIVVGEDEQNGD